MQKIIFWQNIISPHQLDFLKAVSQHYEVTLIVERIQDAHRKKDGWEIPDADYLNTIVSPPKSSLDTFFKNKETLHVFSGISAYKTVFKGFKMAVKHNAKIGIFSEPIPLSGLKGFLKLIRGKLQRIKYEKKIHFICATGNLGVDCYRKFGYPNDKIFQWGYFVNTQINEVQDKKNELIFVGNLNDNKQIKPLIEILSQNNFCGFNKINVIGSGILGDELIHLYKDEKRINFCGRLTNKETIKWISSSKFLIIPSLSDGWAVVVNEALLCGTPVIASDQVGASALLDNKKRGAIFKAGNKKHLKEVLIEWSNYHYTDNDYQEIQQWARKNITPTVAASYFEEIIDYSFHRGLKKPVAPWLKN